ncbi:hypothetical protein QA600_18485 [Natronococcus sp. A-GB1]|uniref:hypothetical protein n=1 Tax=Natronococcus sp. A-GB1 TaxID=3037648 RepID=UPI00241F8184|nr:hypothetical protein [Natronococcus sp. A-GB1]MDG5761321.1 hypothetical protein [Natronococcus sp. A-GB1]
MTRTTAVTREYEYDTTDCQICSTTTAIGDAPADISEPHGYAVVLGTGTVSHDTEDAGNWDDEFQFTLTEDHDHLPAVTGHIICADCATTIHDHPTDTTPFHGTIPAPLTATPTATIDPSLQPLLYYVAAVLLIFLFILLLL